jgi:hypothetical protein
MVVGQAERHLENTIFNVEEKDAKDKTVDWRQVLDLDGLSDEQKVEVTRVLDSFAHLWDHKRLGVLHGTRHRNEAQSSSTRTEPVPLHARLKRRK